MSNHSQRIWAAPEDESIIWLRPSDDGLTVLTDGGMYFLSREWLDKQVSRVKDDERRRANIRVVDG